MFWQNFRQNWQIFKKILVIDWQNVTILFLFLVIVIYKVRFGDWSF
jgi:hypothetical protein